MIPQPPTSVRIKRYLGVLLSIGLPFALALWVHHEASIEPRALSGNGGQWLTISAIAFGIVTVISGVINIVAAKTAYRTHDSDDMITSLVTTVSLLAAVVSVIWVLVG